MDPNPSNPFGDYQPKRTPDTIFDFRPSMHAVIEAIPLLTTPDVDKLPALVQLLEDVKAKARKTPGQTQPGNVILGGDREEYKPSDDELLESFIGALIKNLILGVTHPRLQALLKKVKSDLTYNTIRVRHSDVMGSGRFFYASKPQQEKIQL